MLQRAVVIYEYNLPPRQLINHGDFFVVREIHSLVTRKKNHFVFLHRKGYLLRKSRNIAFLRQCNEATLSNRSDLVLWKLTIAISSRECAKAGKLKMHRVAVDSHRWTGVLTAYTRLEVSSYSNGNALLATSLNLLPHCPLMPTKCLFPTPRRHYFPSGNRIYYSSCRWLSLALAKRS